MTASRPLRILVAVRPGTLLRFTFLIPALVGRGHAVHVAFGRRPEKRMRRFLDAHPNTSFDIAAVRDERDGWAPVAALVRGLGDLARFSHPRYDRAPVLRERAAEAMREIVAATPIEPSGRAAAERLARRLSSTSDAGFADRVVGAMARLEEAIPPSPPITGYLRGHAPDVVLAASITRTGSDEVEYLKSARSLGLPTGVCVASWDKLTNKGLLKFVPERVFVWNEVQAREAVDFHGVPRDHVVVTGAHSFDEWFARRPARDRADHVRSLGLDPAKPYVLYLCSSPMTTGTREVEFVQRWIETLRASDDAGVRGLSVAIRPHPSAVPVWRDVDLSGLGDVALCESRHHFGEAARAEFFEVLAHSAAVVGINTTAMIEAAVLGKSVLTVLHGDFAQESTLHFHYLLEENGGFLHVAGSLEEHAKQLGRVLASDEAGAERRRRFVESFVRPLGLGEPAAPILADAIEELARLPVTAAPAAATLTTPLLEFEAMLDTLHGREARSERPATAAAAAD